MFEVRYVRVHDGVFVSPLNCVMAGLDPASTTSERVAEAAPKQLPMSLLAKQVEQLTEADLQSLVTSRVPESELIDYKQTAVGNSDKDRYEFPADVSSFANSSGGEIIFGIAEANGLPSQICGLNVLNGDQETLRLGRWLAPASVHLFMA